MRLREFYPVLARAIQEYLSKWYLPPSGIQLNYQDWNDMCAEADIWSHPPGTLLGIPVVTTPHLCRGNFRLIEAHNLIGTTVVGFIVPRAGLTITWEVRHDAA